MSQHDYNIANATFPNVRSDLNNALGAVATNNAGNSAPSTTYANQWWFDSDGDKLYMRNKDNDAWVEILTIGATSDDVQSLFANVIAEGTSATGVTVDGMLIKDGGFTATLGCAINLTDTSDALTLKTTDVGSGTGPVLLFNRDSGSPANNDFLGEITFQGDNNAGQAHDYIRMFARILNVADGSEQADFIMKDATGNNIVNFAHSEVVYNDDSVDRDFRVESNGDANCFVVDAGGDRVDIRTGGTNLGGVFNVIGTAVISIDDNSDTLTLISTDADANAGPNLRLYRNTSSPADNDLVGKIDFEGRNDNSQDVVYSAIELYTSDVSDGTEDGALLIRSMVAGTNTQRITLMPTETVINEDSKALSFRVESDDSTKAFFVSGSYANAHITATGSATKVSYYSGGMGNLQLGIGGGIYSYDYNVIDGPYVYNNSYMDNGTEKYVGSGPAGKIGQYNGQFQYYNAGSGSADGAISYTERFRIDNSGNITATDTTIGSISDERLKENITDFTYDVAKFKQFKPKTFDWKNPELHTGVTNNRGFIAQEIETVDDYYINAEELELPQTQETGNADYNLIPEDEDGKRITYTSKLGKKDAMYISVIQQLITRIEALES